MSNYWWGEAVLTTNYVLNRVPPRNQEETPYEGWQGRKPNLSFLRTWGCLTKVHVLLPKKRKLDPKTVDCVFLGYAKNSIAYRFLVVKSEMSDIATNVTMESCDAIFFEHVFPMRTNEVIVPTGSDKHPILPSVDNTTPKLELRRSKR